MPFLKPAIAVLILALSFTAPAQVVPYSSRPDNEPANKEMLAALTKRYEQDLATLSGSNKKYIAEVYKERWSLIKERITAKEIITATETQAYLKSLTNEIFRWNPTISDEGLRIFFSKSFYANASSMGEGTILFNIGLFHRLENESQVVFVLCHELAHYFLKHSNDNISSYITTIYSDEFQRQLRSIKKSGYQQNNQLESLSKNLMFRNRRHSRAFEQAADSMALELLKNTGYDVQEALSCLASLDSADKDKYNTELALDKQFNFASFPFKKSWLESDDLVFTDTKNRKEKKEEDSLKTHPDCSVRIERLKQKVTEYTRAGSRKFVVDEKRFSELRSRFDYEIVAYCFNSKQISRALYFSLQMLQQYPSDVYLNTMVGKCLNEIYAAQKNHVLSKIVDLPDKRQEPKYNAVLNLIQNLRLSEVAALSYHFLKIREPQLLTDNDFRETFSISKQNFNLQ